MPAYTIGGSIPFSNAGGAMFSGLGGNNPEDALAAHYSQAYTSAAQMNQRQYQNILRGYQQVLGGLQGAANRIGRGYGRLTNNVFADIEGVGDAQRQEIADMYEARRGQETQNLLGLGLGSSTVRTSMERGLTLDEAKAGNQLAEALAKMRAGYRTQIGLGGLGAKERMAQAVAAQGGSQLEWMNSIDMPYPDAGAYGQLAAMIGQAKEAQKQRDYMSSLLQASMGSAMAGLGPVERLSPHIGGNAARWGLEQGLAAIGMMGSGGFGRGQPDGGGGGGGGSYGGGGYNMGLGGMVGGSTGGFSFGGGYDASGGFGAGGPPGYTSGGFGMGLGTSYGQSGAYGGSPFSFGGGYSMPSGMSGGFGGFGGTGGYSYDQFMSGLGSSVAQGLANAFQ